MDINVLPVTEIASCPVVVVIEFSVLGEDFDDVTAEISM
jgi:hypothetical protein